MRVRVAAVMAMVLPLGAGLGAPAAASNHEQTVTATVTAIVVAVSLSPTSLAYGSIPLGSSNNTPTPAFFTATNDGSVTVNLAIRGNNTANWSLVTGTPAADQYRHRASITSNFSTTIDLTTSNLSLVSGLAPASSQNVWLRLDAPSTTSVTAQQSAQVTVVATGT